MKLIRVKHNNNIFYAILRENSVFCLEPSFGYKEEIPFEELLLLPLVIPSKIVCVGLNYTQHAKELNLPLPEQPAFFLKPPSSIISHLDAIVLPDHVGRVDFEGELAVIIGQTCKNIHSQDASKYILGYTCANDVTARDLQKGEVLMGRCKSFDTFCPVGPCIETEEPHSSAIIRTVVNGNIKQESLLGDMIFSPHELIANISQVMTLFPGDLVLTGTPHGVGKLLHGDVVRVEIEGIAALENQVENQIAPDSIIVQ